MFGYRYVGFFSGGIKIKDVTFIAIVIAVILTVLVLVLVTPESRRAKLPAFFRFFHDYFNSKFLILEKILKAIHILSTLFVFVFGLISIFSDLGISGLLIAIFGPIVLRIIYEAIMMFIFVVKNVIEINNKMKINQNVTPAAPVQDVSVHNVATPVPPVAPVQEPATQKLQPVYKYCRKCGLRYDANIEKKCSNCNCVF